YALPADQVEAEVTVWSWREFPDGPGIAPGVSTHEGDIWPLIDLCPYFGTRMRLQPGMTALAVENGRFKALLLVDKILPRRDLADLVQRELPFALPHRIVYGCYLEESNVSLILNVQAMVRHFDPSLVKDLLKHLPGRTHEDALSSGHDSAAASGLTVDEEELPVDEEELP
ncbi:MAG: hypothetical protein GWO11_02385, partial [Desulfuromonadales bacterium]|nr:hypothetical protein [Desulfuromonadales bacterium]